MTDVKHFSEPRCPGSVGAAQPGTPWRLCPLSFHACSGRLRCSVDPIHFCSASSVCKLSGHSSVAEVASLRWPLHLCFLRGPQFSLGGHPVPLVKPLSAVLFSLFANPHIAGYFLWMDFSWSYRLLFLRLTRLFVSSWGLTF